MANYYSVYINSWNNCIVHNCGTANSNYTESLRLVVSKTNGFIFWIIDWPRSHDTNA
ncbi:MAG: hypothetical protein JWP69_158 [Flaviaesturariibacter sp.]|nr:hypothetical protein [Flaviaesturariibacter sp.]